VLYLFFGMALNSSRKGPVPPHSVSTLFHILFHSNRFTPNNNKNNISENSFLKLYFLHCCCIFSTPFYSTLTFFFLLLTCPSKLFNFVVTFIFNRKWGTEVLLRPVNHIILAKDKRECGSLTTFLLPLAN
jgi:hypothetical protein